MYTQEQIDRAQAMDIVEVARDLELKLKQKGRFHFATCLWHDDNRPSMQVGGTQNTCHCYSCGETHGVIDLVMKDRGCGFQEALRWLLDEEGGQKRERKPQREKREAKQPVFKPVYGYLFRVDMLNGNFLRTAGYAGDLDDFLPSMDNSLSRCLLHYFPRDVVEWVTSRYALGCWTDRMFVSGTMFPIIDREGMCHNIKVQEYDTHPESDAFCHRKGGTVWLGSMLQKEGRYEKGVEFDNRVLFGEHLLLDSGTVALVESPKNAVVGACRWPELIWVAVGNKTALTADMLSPLKGRNVLVFPDKDALPDWQQRISTLRPLANFTFSTGWMDEVPGGKGDIADWVLRYTTS